MDSIKEDAISMVCQASSDSYATSIDEDYLEEDISAHEYARLNSLVCNHREPPPYSHFKDLAFRLPNGVTDDSHLPQFVFPDRSTDERLEITREAAKLLAWSSAVNKETSVDAIVMPMLGSRKIKNQRVELPLLKSDHEIDCRAFALREAFEIKLQDVKLPLEMVDDTKNEGLKPLSTLWGKGEELIKQLKKEKLAVSKETMQSLTNALKLEWTATDEKKLWEELHLYKNTHPLEPVTPPLSPTIPAYIPNEPSLSDPVFEVPLTSDPVSLTNDDLKAIERQIFEQDVPTPIRVATARHIDGPELNTDQEDGSQFLEYLDLSTTTPAASPRIRASELKIEQTLTPPNPLPTKSVNFSEIIEEMRLYTHMDSNSSDAAFESRFFDEAFSGVAANAVRQSEQETLVEADTTARVQVPLMDFSPPDPPWHNLQKLVNGARLLEAQKIFLSERIGGSITKWPLQKLYSKELKWNPFPHDLARVALEEKSTDDTSWEAFVYGPELDDIISTSSLTWKPPGLKILREDDDDDNEIEPSKFPKGVAQNLAFIVRKRKLVIEQQKENQSRSSAPRSLEDQSHAYQSGQIVPASALKKIKQAGLEKIVDNSGTILHMSPSERKRKAMKVPSTTAQISTEANEELELGSLLGGFSAGVSLDNFLQIRGAKKPKLTDSSYFGPKPKPDALPDPEPKQLAMKFPVRKSPAMKFSPLPEPPYENPLVWPPIIVSSSFLKQRSLVKQIEILCPGIKLIERDFAAFNTTTWMQHSVNRSPIASSLAAEADVIISASTGIVISTLQKIKQKPLPGQKTKVAIRERIEKVSPRYEKLIVLVSEGQADDEPLSFDESSCQAIAEFIGFIQALETPIIVHLVGGGESMLSKWLVSCIVKYSAQIPMDLLEEQTHWELFLRRAGMNAFAAQAVIAQLKAPEGVNSQSSSKAGLYGLTAFVEMGREHRLDRFGSLCGYRLMGRVSDLIDARWGTGNM